MATSSPRPQSQSQAVSSSSLQSFVFPNKLSPSPLKRPSSSSALQTRSSFPPPIESSVHFDNNASPINSPSTFVFPLKALPSTPRAALNGNNQTTSMFAGNVQGPRSPPQSPSPPRSHSSGGSLHARRRSELSGGSKQLSLGSFNQNFTLGSASLATPSPSRSGTSSPNRDGVSPRFVSSNGLLSPPPESGPSSPQPMIEKGLPAPAPPGGRNGHAHRRSSAMSMSASDMINMMGKANSANKRGSSTPASPLLTPSTANTHETKGSDCDSSGRQYDGDVTEGKGVIKALPVSERENKHISDIPSSAVSTTSSASSINLVEDSEASRSNSIEEIPRRTRVTFSDATEIIPRPASAGTCSTLTTIRGNSLGDSVSSLVGQRNSISSMDDLQHVDSRFARRASASDAPGFNSSTTKSKRRPNSADAATLLNSTQKTSWLFPPLSPKDPSTKTKKGHKKHLSESSVAGKHKREKPQKVDADGVPVPKKVKGGMKGWAGNILLRRHYKKRQLGPLPRRSPTPPLMQRDEIQRLMLEGSYVLMPTSIEDYQPRDSSSMEDADFEPKIDLGLYEPDMETSSYPVIDLDAALGPFNTPNSPHKQLSGFSKAKKSMHSAAGFYHKRAESMPEMQLFSLAEDEYEGDGMGDVFEDSEDEDSEDEDEADTTLRPEDFPVQQTPTPVASGLALNWDTDDSEVEELDIVDGLSSVRKGIKRKMSRLSEDNPVDTAMATTSESDSTPKADDSSSFIETASISTPNTDIHQLSPSVNANNPLFLSYPGLQKPMINASSNLSYGSLHHSSSFDQTPAVTPSTTSTSICPPTMPSTPQNSDFLLPPMPHMYHHEDDRATLMSGASIYEDPSLLGEPGPEIRMSVSVDDIPGMIRSHSSPSRGYYPYIGKSASYTTMPGLETPSIAGSERTKEKKDKRWSRVFSFWRSKSHS